MQNLLVLQEPALGFYALHTLIWRNIGVYLFFFDPEHGIGAFNLAIPPLFYTVDIPFLGEYLNIH